MASLDLKLNKIAARVIGVYVACLVASFSPAVWSAHAQTYSLTNLAQFSSLVNGSYPVSQLLIDSHGNLFGSAIYGKSGVNGNPGGSSIFEYTAATHSISDIATVAGITTNADLAMDTSGDIYGISALGSAGSVFEVASGSHALSEVARFQGSEYQGPATTAGLAIDGNGDLFGTTDFASDTTQGTVFEIASGSKTVTTLASFSAGNSKVGVTLDAAGDAFGILGAGTSDYSIYEVKAGSNAATIIASLGPYGSFDNNPSPLTIDSKGDLFGVTEGGGAYRAGSIYELADKFDRYPG